MDREYLEDYEQREKEEFERLVSKRMREGKFDFEKDILQTRGSSIFKVQ